MYYTNNNVFTADYRPPTDYYRREGIILWDYTLYIQKTNIFYITYYNVTLILTELTKGGGKKYTRCNKHFKTILIEMIFFKDVLS